MVKVFGANVIVSKNGKNDENPIKELADGKVVAFRVGYKVYDSTAEDNERWVNVTVKAFGTMAERVKKMKMKIGSGICLSGDLDVEKWEKDDVKGFAPVIYLNDIQYQSGGSSSKKEDEESSSKTKKARKKTPSYEEYDENDEEEEEETKKKSKKKPSKEDYEDDDDGYNPFD